MEDMDIEAESYVGGTSFLYGLWGRRGVFLRLSLESIG